LAGVSDRVFRVLVRRWAPEALLFTEMVNATSLELGHGRDKVEELGGEAGPIGVQLFDHRPEAMAEAARRAEAAGAFLIDINMGCPVPKIARKGGGSGLMRDPDLAARIVEAVAAAVAIPVTVKTRLGWCGSPVAGNPGAGDPAAVGTAAAAGPAWVAGPAVVAATTVVAGPAVVAGIASNEPVFAETASGELAFADVAAGMGGPGADPALVANAVAWCQRLERAGAQLLTLHGRSRAQGFKGQADWLAIAAVKRALAIPLIASGDVTSAEAALRCLAISGADGVMVGRGSMGNPWLVGQIDAALRGRPLPPTPNAAGRLALAREHLLALLAARGDHGLLIARKHLGWTCVGFPGAPQLRHALMRAPTPAATLELLDQAAAALAAEP
jgi:tRNA-dihydrouridine synthase